MQRCTPFISACFSSVHHHISRVNSAHTPTFITCSASLLLRHYFTICTNKMTDAPPAAQQQNNIILKLKSRDGETFDVEKPVAMQINFVKGMLEDVDEVDGMEIPMGEVDACILAKVVEFCKFHHQQEINQTAPDEVDRWEKGFVQVDKSTLFQLILAANFLDVQTLLDLTCKTVADMIKGKTPEQIRAEFNIENDFTPEQIEEVRRDNAWCSEER